MTDQWLARYGALKSLQTNGTAVPDIETRLEARAAAFLETGMGLAETYQLCIDALAEIRRLRANACLCSY